MDEMLDSLADLVSFCREAPWHEHDRIAGYEIALYAARKAGFLVYMDLIEILDILDDMRDLAHMAHLRASTREAA